MDQTNQSSMRVYRESTSNGVFKKWRTKLCGTANEAGNDKTLGPRITKKLAENI